MAFDRIAVVGAGAWGSALANTLARAGRKVTLFARNRASADRLRQTRESPRLLGIQLDPRIAFADAESGMSPHDSILLAVPSQQLREVARIIGQGMIKKTPVIACAKGIEHGTHKFMTEVISESLPGAVPAILSGPSFAQDVARGLPTAVTLATRDKRLASVLAGALGSTFFRLYHSTDIRGVEIGGAAKNVLAIAAGVATGRGLGASAVAALVTRGFAELFRFGKALQARPQTLTGLSGLGDLILTCSSIASRNYSFGIALGKGQSADSASSGKLAEGIFTAPVLLEMAQARSIEMPIASAVVDILQGRATVEDAIERILTRPFRAEA
jgi:glycerol-3-phosphate dehydrogenase (NAD(P)+)